MTGLDGAELRPPPPKLGFSERIHEVFGCVGVGSGEVLCLPAFDMPSEGPDGGEKPPGWPPEDEPAVDAEIIACMASCALAEVAWATALSMAPDAGLVSTGAPVPCNAVPVSGR